MPCNSRIGDKEGKVNRIWNTIKRKERKGVREVEKEIVILKKEVESLKSQVRTLRVFYLTVIVMFISSIINFRIQYSQIRSYYQATAESNQEILLNLKWQNSELQRSLSIIEEILPD